MSKQVARPLAFPSVVVGQVAVEAIRDGAAFLVTANVFADEGVYRVTAVLFSIVGVPDMVEDGSLHITRLDEPDSYGVTDKVRGQLVAFVVNQMQTIPGSTIDDLASESAKVTKVWRTAAKRAEADRLAEERDALTERINALESELTPALPAGRRRRKPHNDVYRWWHVKTLDGREEDIHITHPAGIKQARAAARQQLGYGRLPKGTEITPLRKEE